MLPGFPAVQMRNKMFHCWDSVIFYQDVKTRRAENYGVFFTRKHWKCYSWGAFERVFRLATCLCLNLNENRGGLLLCSAAAQRVALCTVPVSIPLKLTRPTINNAPKKLKIHRFWVVIPVKRWPHMPELEELSIITQTAVHGAALWRKTQLSTLKNARKKKTLSSVLIKKKKWIFFL